jgi:DNA replication protein DnaC
MLRRLHLANAPRVYRGLCEQAEREHWSYHDFLSTLVAEEIAHRQQTRLQRLARKARFPFIKTIEEFDFTFQSTVRQALIGSYLTADFVTDGRCLVLSGKTGRGKTHLAIAIAYRAIQNGFDSLFCTAAAVIDALSDAAASGRLRERLHDFVSPDVLVIDEVGYLSYGPDAANVLFHVVNERHQKRRAMLFTTNKQTAEWGSVLHDYDLADAIVDRILERGRVLKLDGPSYRTKHLSLDGQPQPGVSTKPARISGIQPAEFLEPTSTASAIWEPHGS